MIRKSQLQDKTLEELAYTKELSIRKKIMKDFNKSEDDFSTLDAYNDYLEQVEDLIFDLVNGGEVAKQTAQKTWKDYRNENLIQIASNDARKAEEERRLNQLIAQQQRTIEDQRQLQMKEDAQHSADVQQRQKQLMEVALGERDQSEVMELRTTTTATAIDAAPLTAEMQAAMIGFQPGNLVGGPQPQPIPGGKKGPTFGLSESKQVRKEQQRAGGYDIQYQLCRNKSEAWMGLRLFFHAYQSTSSSEPVAMDLA